VSKQPNFLFFITDQQRADWLGCYGHPVLKTPHIDAIAAQGVRYEQFHVATPLCMPNRASLITGRFPSVHGLRYNGCRLPLGANTFVNVLANNGYHTASIGKSHLQPFTGLPQKDQGQKFAAEEAWSVDDGNYYQEEAGRYESDGRYQFETPYYGYQHVDVVTSHGDRCGGHYRQWFRENAPDWQALYDDANELPHNYSCPQAYRTPVPEELYPTAYIRDSAISYLQSRQNNDQPFFAFVSFPDPHHPFNPPGKYWDMYSPDDFSVNLPYSAHKNPTKPMQWLHDSWQTGDGSQLTPQTAMMVDEPALKEAMALTAGMMSMVDDAVGDVVASLKQTGLMDNTVICYNSDHGDYLGDFNMLLKSGLPFKSITRVPFIWSDPQNRKASVSDAMASTVDIGPTILERAGLEPYNGTQGLSFLNTLSGGQGKREDLLIECNDGSARFGFDKAARIRSVVSQNWRYTLYLGEEWGELYNLKDDPDETQNLWDSEAHKDIRLALSERLNQHLTNQMDESPRADRLA